MFFLALQLCCLMKILISYRDEILEDSIFLISIFLFTNRSWDLRNFTYIDPDVTILLLLNEYKR